MRCEERQSRREFATWDHALACIAPQKPAPLTPAMLKKTRFPPQKPFLSIQHSPDVVAWKAAHWLHHRARALWDRGETPLGCQRCWGRGGNPALGASER